MPKRKRKANSRESALAKSIGLLISQVRIGNQELRAELGAMRDEMHTGFDQVYRHIDGFVKLHETSDKKGEDLCS